MMLFSYYVMIYVFHYNQIQSAVSKAIDKQDFMGNVNLRNGKKNKCNTIDLVYLN